MSNKSIALSFNHYKEKAKKDAEVHQNAMVTGFISHNLNKVSSQV